MSSYTPEQWMLLFYFYCLCGWVWESCYVSACQHHWVNRGFLHGPLLPIYGSGAIVILFVTLPVRTSLPLIFLLGMLAATLLELVVGWAMEQMFKVRYWDYTGKFCNLGGYICLTSSLAWGGFSVLLVRLIHPPVDWLLLSLPQTWVIPLSWSLTVCFSVDTIQSLRAALDLRKVLTTLTEENETLRRLAKRAEVLSAFAGEDLEKFRARTQLERVLLAQRLEQVRGQRGKSRKERLEELLRARTAARLKALDNVAEALETLSAHLEERYSDSALETIRQELREGLDRLHTQKIRIRSRHMESYHRAMRILHAHPTASAQRHAEALETLRELGWNVRTPNDSQDDEDI